MDTTTTAPTMTPAAARAFGRADCRRASDKEDATQARDAFVARWGWDCERDYLHGWWTNAIEELEPAWAEILDRAGML